MIFIAKCNPIGGEIENAANTAEHDFNKNS